MKNSILIFILVLFSFYSCDDVFDVAPQDKISENNVWNDETLLRLYLNACYTATFQQGLYRNTQIGAATDEIHSIKNAGNYYIIQRNELTADNVRDLNDYLNNWKSAYSTIRDVNIFFEKIDEAPVSDDVKEEMKGEMHFIRAFLYSQLLWRYGGVPIITEVFELNDDYDRSRDSYDDCLQFILDEIDEAIAVLPDKQEGDDLGKASADAARALKARLLLYAASPLNNPENDISKWQAAANAAEELIGKYSLHNDYQQLFLGHSDEVIFARYFTQQNSHDLSLQVGRNGDNGWGSDSPTQNLVDDYEMDNGEFPFLDDGSVNPASGYNPDNPYDGRDPRFYASILYDGSFWMGRETETFEGGLDSRDGPIAAWNGTMTGYYLKKFVPEDIPPTGSTVRPTTPWIMFRYAEVLLNYAEASFMLGTAEGEETARQYLNMVRNRPGVEMPPVDATGENLLDRIRHERRIELVFEGHRYFDVRRWKIADETESKNIMGVTIEKNGNTKTYIPKQLVERSWDDRLYRLPIPQVEIDRSNGALDQNPGYY
jgi:hypothetical protein